MPLVAILGDVGGHLGPFDRACRDLGVDTTIGHIPDDTMIIQVGDLVHRGPDSDAVVALADLLLTASPGRYIQLAGNHEALHFGGPPFWDCRCSEQTVDTLHAWSRGGRLHVGAAVDSAEYGPVLVTHAGMTRAWYHDPLATPSMAARAFNGWWADPESRPALLEAGEMLEMTDGRTGSAGPLWASERELLSSWIDSRLPYSQVHGHNSAYDWSLGAWRDPGLYAVRLEVDAEARRTMAMFPGGSIIGIDPGFGAEAPTWSLTPLILTVPAQTGA
jgi:hypothetical protein